MPLSAKAYSVLMLVLSGLFIFYILFLLLLVPILPLGDDNILQSFSPTPVLLCSGICGFIFIGSLSIFTIIVMKRNQSKFKG